MGLDEGPQAPVTPPVALTIAGSDSGGGAGVQADLKTFAACGVHGTSALTLITAQNTRGVSHIELLAPHVIKAQLDALRQDLPAQAVKTGALGSEPVIAAVVEWCEEHPEVTRKLVVDPVMVSKHGDPLMGQAAQRYLRDRLLSRALIVTPNHHEAEAMLAREVGDLQSMRDACKRLHDFGSRYVLLKGSHLDRIVRDLLYDGKDFYEFGADRVRTTRTHGSGCTFSAAIVARLAHGDTVLEAVEFARGFITKAIERAPALGSGVAPVHPLHEWW